MSFLKDILGLSKKGPVAPLNTGTMVGIGEEETSSTVVGHISDNGTFLQFQAYFSDIRPEIVENDHIHQGIYFCALVKLGILQKRGNAYLPPEEIFTQMAGPNGLQQVSFYRKKSNTSGTSFGFDYDSIGQFNTKHKVELIDLLQEVEDALDIAWEEANDIAAMLKERHRANPNKSGKASTHRKRDLMFKDDKAEILKQILGC